jgi:hypothetical protein
VSVKKKWNPDVAAARKNCQAGGIMRTGFASSRRALTALAVALCVVSAWPAQAITSNNHFTSAVPVTSETAYTGVFESGAQPCTGLFGADNPVNCIDPSGHDYGDFDINIGSIGNLLDQIDGATLDFGGKGGPDIDAALNATLTDVTSDFGSWNNDVAKTSGYGLLPNWTLKAEGSWDIRELKDGGAPGDPLKSGRTITFHGVTYYSSAANYALWGKAYRLCHDRFSHLDEPWNLDNALALASAHKYFDTQGGLDSEWQEALWFTRYGYDGTLPPRIGISGRNPNPTPFSSSDLEGGRFHWKWLPGKNY